MLIILVTYMAALGWKSLIVVNTSVIFFFTTDVEWLVKSLIPVWRMILLKVGPAFCNLFLQCLTLELGSVYCSFLVASY